MSLSDQKIVYDICQKFLREHIPEYVRDMAHDLILDNGPQKIDLQEGDNWTVKGVIQGEDLQVYTPKIEICIADHQLRQECNCQAAFSGSCTHVATLILQLLENLKDTQNDTTDDVIPVKDWKQSFHSFFTSEIEPEAGRHYLLFRFHPEHERLLVSFFRARQNKTSVSSVHNEITLEHLIQNPDWCEFSPHLPEVAKQIGQYLGYYGHCVEIPQGLISWFFWSIRNEYYLLWKDTDKHLRIETATFSLKLNPKFNESDFTFEILDLAKTKKSKMIQLLFMVKCRFGCAYTTASIPCRQVCPQISFARSSQILRPSPKKICPNSWIGSGQSFLIAISMSPRTSSNAWNPSFSQHLTTPNYSWMKKVVC